MKSAAQRRPSRDTHCPMLISSAPSTVTLRFLPGAKDLRAGAAQGPAGPHVRQQVQVAGALLIACAVLAACHSTIPTDGRIVNGQVVVATDRIQAPGPIIGRD
jgi:hypothetical protein